MFAYYTTFVEINPDLVKHILDGYAADNWWARVHKQILDNEKLGFDKAILPFVVADSLLSNFDPYFQPRPEDSKRVLHDLDINNLFFSTTENQLVASGASKSQLIYHLNCLTGVCRLCISPTVVPELLFIAHGKCYPGFSGCHEIIFRSWYI